MRVATKGVPPSKAPEENFLQTRGSEGYAEHLIVSAPSVLESSVLPNIRIPLAALFA